MALNAIKSLLPRASPETSDVPALGAPAPKGLNISPGHPTIVAFVRHCGCPFAAKEVLVLGQQVQKYPELHVIIVQHSEEPVVKEWFDIIGGPAAFGDRIKNLRLVADPERKIYAGWGVGVLGWGGILNMSGGFSKLSELSAEGIPSPFTLDGSWRWQNSGGFALDKSSIIRWEHIAVDAADMCDYATAASTLCG